MSQSPGPATEGAGQAFLKNLRQSTAHNHAALEAHPLSGAITSPLITLDDYARYLQVMHGVVAGMEASLCNTLNTIVPDMQERTKKPWIEEDLISLGYSSTELEPFVLPVKDPAIPYALGAFYVLEGSTLGVRVILKSLPGSLGRAAEKGSRYFAGYGPATGARWESFLTDLCSYAVSNHCEEEVIAGANDAFAGIIDYFNYCCVHEAQRHCQS